MNTGKIRKACVHAIFVHFLIGMASCSNNVLSRSKDTVKRELPSEKAGQANTELLALVHNQTSSKPPAAIRPDPDTYIRTLLRQYREEGSIIAQEIGRVEDYRPLLGGASEDFSKAPQLTYDATSLLAVQKVSEEICTGLIAPNATHAGWTTILPHPPSEVLSNLRFLAQRFIGLPQDRISAETINGLQGILVLSLEDGSVTLESYISVCVALSIDAEALLL